MCPVPSGVNVFVRTLHLTPQSASVYLALRRPVRMRPVEVPRAAALAHVARQAHPASNREARKGLG